MLSSVSPVWTGAGAASPQPTAPLSASIRTRTVSARRSTSAAMMTGLCIGRLTAIGSMVLICTTTPRKLVIPGRREAPNPETRCKHNHNSGFRVHASGAPRNDRCLELGDPGLVDDVLEH